jgi:hypothetical protein
MTGLFSPFGNLMTLLTNESIIKSITLTQLNKFKEIYVINKMYIQYYIVYSVDNIVINKTRNKHLLVEQQTGIIVARRRMF